jgi:antitoxin (DNA-binding transcriptional repressor) of toxin-antitoxin stability system
VKTLNISYFKTHISQELRSVRDGERIIIMDRDIPVAEVIPHREESKLRVRQPTSKLSLRTLSFEVDTDPLEVLMEDRGKR